MEPLFKACEIFFYAGLLFAAIALLASIGKGSK